MGFFFVSATAAASCKSRTIAFPCGSVEDTSSRVKTLTLIRHEHKSDGGTRSEHAFGPETAAAVVEPGTMPKDAFHRAKLSSSASRLAYSSAVFAAPGLYPSRNRRKTA